MRRRGDAYDDGFGTWVTGALIVAELIVGSIWWVFSILVIVALGVNDSNRDVPRPSDWRQTQIWLFPLVSTLLVVLGQTMSGYRRALAWLAAFVVAVGWATGYAFLG